MYEVGPIRIVSSVTPEFFCTWTLVNFFSLQPCSGMAAVVAAASAAAAAAAGDALNASRTFWSFRTLCYGFDSNFFETVLGCF